MNIEISCFALNYLLNMAQYGIHDPVHGWIEYSSEEKEVIDSRLVQRLRWVSQLTGASEVFPGGTNTRFLHSIGAMHLAGKYFDSLAKQTEFPIIPERRNYYRTLVRLGGLLHDIGHGPFSHAFDSSVYQEIYGIKDGGHDRHREIIVHSDLLAPHLRRCGVEPDDLIALWNANSSAYQNKPKEEQEILDICHLLVQGPLGADRMDFTLRDSYFMGTTSFGDIASDRIIGNAIVKRVNNRLCLCYRSKCLSDIIEALESRFNMYENIYLHKAVCATGLLIETMMSTATKDLRLIERTKDIHSFVLLNDSTLIGEIMTTPIDTPDIRKSRHYLQMLLDRRLPKMVSEERIEGEEKEIPVLDGNEMVFTSRRICGVDTTYFEKAGIHFLTRDGGVLTCSEALASIHYTTPRAPFYFRRIYRLSV